MRAAWRRAQADDDEQVVAMCLGLYAEDPGSSAVDRSKILRTLDTFRGEPLRGRAVVAEVDGQICGYALLVSFWSNELGGSVCEVDELFIQPSMRGQGLGSSLFAAIERGEVWEQDASAIVLMVTDPNRRARSLYERLGFKRLGTSMVRSLRR